MLLKSNSDLIQILSYHFTEKLAEATRKYAGLQSELKTAQDLQHGGGKNKGKNAFKSSHLPARKMRELKLAFSEFYLSLILLQNYQNLNYTGFRKILKKHDKVSYVLTFSRKSSTKFIKKIHKNFFIL